MHRNLDRLVLRSVSFWAQFTDSLHAGLQSGQSDRTKEQLAGRGAFKGAVDCSQSPIFSWDRLDIPRLTVTGILIFKGTEGAGVGDYSSAPAPWVVLTLMQDGSPSRKALDLHVLTKKWRTVNSLRERSMMQDFRQSSEAVG